MPIPQHSPSEKARMFSIRPARPLQPPRATPCMPKNKENSMRTPWIIRQTALALGLSLAGLSAHADLPNDTIGQETLPFPPSPHRAYIVDAEFEMVDEDKKS